MNDARPIANRFLDFAEKHGIRVNNPKLQAVLYFCYGNYLATFEACLFAQEFEYTDWGPVITVVNEQFEHLGEDPITGRVMVIDVKTGAYKEARRRISRTDSEFLDGMFENIGFLDHRKLVGVMRAEGSAWHRFREGEIRCAFGKIKPDYIKQDFAHPAAYN